MRQYYKLHPTIPYMELMHNMSEEVVIETIRLDSVTEIIENFVKKTKMDNQYTQYLLNIMYRLNVGTLNMAPGQLLFDNQLVHQKLNDIHIWILDYKRELKEKSDQNTLHEEQVKFDEGMLKALYARCIGIR